jgi:hypothetical protein
MSLQYKEIELRVCYLKTVTIIEAGHWGFESMWYMGTVLLLNFYLIQT